VEMKKEYETMKTEEKLCFKIKKRKRKANCTEGKSGENIIKIKKGRGGERILGKACFITFEKG